MEQGENDWMIFHTAVLSVLICSGLWTNSMFLMSLKANKPKINNNERVQVFKTCFIILALIVYIPMNLWVIQPGNASFISCVVTGAFKNLFLNMYPVGMAAIAIIRLRLATCKGNAGILVKKIFFVSITLGCTLVVVFTSLTFVVLSFFSVRSTSANESRLDEKSTNDTSKDERIIGETLFCYQILGDTINKFNIAIILLTYVTSSVVAIVSYLLIVIISTQSIRRVQQFTRNNVRRIATYAGPRINSSNTHESPVATNDMETHTRGKKICKSIGILLGVFFLVTIPIITLEIFFSLKEPQFSLNITLLYFKVLMCVLHSVGEGTFTSEKLALARLFFTRHKVTNSKIVVRSPKNVVSNTTCMSEKNACGQNRHNSVISTRFLSTLNEIKETNSTEDSQGAQFCTEINGNSSWCNNNSSISNMCTSELPDDKNYNQMVDTSRIFSVNFEQHKASNVVIGETNVTYLDGETANETKIKKVSSFSHTSLRSISRMSRQTITSTGRLSRFSWLTRQTSETSTELLNLRSSVRPSIDACDVISTDLDCTSLRLVSQRRFKSGSRTSTCSLLTIDSRTRRMRQSSESKLSSSLRPSLDVFCTPAFSDAVLSPTESINDTENNPFGSNQTFKDHSNNENTIRHISQQVDELSDSLESKEIQDRVRALSVLSDNM